jgi:hypothetical protein
MPMLGCEQRDADQARPEGASRQARALCEIEMPP